jgi:hypothetical protein
MTAAHLNEMDLHAFCVLVTPTTFGKADPADLDARLDCQGMRQKLASTISTMRDIQAELLRLAP